MTEATTGLNPVSVPPSPGLTHEHNGVVTTTVTMYKNGVAAQIQESDVPKMQVDGWLLFTPADLADLGRQVTLDLTELSKLANGFIEKVLADGVISSEENAELQAMNTALNGIQQKMQSIVSVAAANYPMVQGIETAEARAVRHAIDMAHNEWTPSQLQKTYGLTDEERDAAVNATIPPPEPEPVEPAEVP